MTRRVAVTGLVLLVALTISALASAASTAGSTPGKPPTITEGSSAGLSSGIKCLVLMGLTTSTIGAAIARIKRDFTAPGLKAGTRFETVDVVTTDRENQPDDRLPTERAHERSDLTYRLAEAC